MESLIIPSKLVLSFFFLACKLLKSGLQIVYLIYDHFRFFESVDIGGLVVALFETWILTLSQFFNYFFIGIHKKCKSNHYLYIF